MVLQGCGELAEATVPHMPVPCDLAAWRMSVSCWLLCTARHSFFEPVSSHSILAGSRRR